MLYSSYKISKYFLFSNYLDIEGSQEAKASKVDCDKMEKQLEDVTVTGINRLQSFSKEMK